MFGLLTGGIAGKIIIGLVLVITILIGLSYWYFTYSQNQIQILAGNTAKLELSVKIQTDTIKKMISQQEKSATQMKVLNSKFNKSDTENRKLVKMLAKHRANMSKIIEKKATLYERLVNKGTKKVLEQFETITDPETYNANSINGNSD